MVNYSSAVLDATFAALSDPTRRGILARLAEGESSVSELAAPYEMSLPAVSKHLRVLESAGLIARQKDGRVHHCRFVADPMKNAAEWIERYRRFWEEQLDALALYLEQSSNKENPKWQLPIPVAGQHSRSGASSRRRGKKSSRRGPNCKP
jgi:DNA-binding transcriptional ArsR family regulator